MLKVVQENTESNVDATVHGGSLLDEIVRDGARQMLAAALQAEVAAYVERYAHEVDEHGHPVPLEYAGARVPKQMNQLGFADSETQGTFSPDDSALMHRVHEIHSDNHDEEAEMFRRLNEANRREDEENGRI